MSNEANQIITIDDINCCYDRNTTSFHPIEGREKEFEESMRQIEEKYLKDAGIAMPASDEARAIARALFAANLLESTLQAIAVTPNKAEQEVINRKETLARQLNNYKQGSKQSTQAPNITSDIIKHAKSKFEKHYS